MELKFYMDRMWIILKMYMILKYFKASKEIRNTKELISKITFKKNKVMGNKIKKMGNIILNKTIKDINQFL